VREAVVCYEFINGGVFRSRACEELVNINCQHNVQYFELIEWRISTQKRVFNAPARPRPRAAAVAAEAEEVREEEEDKEEGNEKGKGDEDVAEEAAKEEETRDEEETTKEEL
jgi:hypothetical protein